MGSGVSTDLPPIYDSVEKALADGKSEEEINKYLSEHPPKPGASESDASSSPADDADKDAAPAPAENDVTEEKRAQAADADAPAKADNTVEKPGDEKQATQPTQPESDAALSAWLASLPKESAEEIIDPDLEIVDPHHHLWSIAAFNFPPFSHFKQKLYQGEEEYLNDVLISSARWHRVVGTVYVQCGQGYRVDEESAKAGLKEIGETEFAAKAGVAVDEKLKGEAGASNCARKTLQERGGELAVCAGIIGTCDLSVGGEALAVVLDAHIAAGNTEGVDGKSRFKGVRTDLPQNAMEDEKWLSSLTLLEQRGLVWENFSSGFNGAHDAGKSEENVGGRLAIVAKLAAKFPKLTIVVNHLGHKIDPAAMGTSDSEAFKSWKAALQAVADAAKDSKNVFLKLGGTGQGPEPEYHMGKRTGTAGEEALPPMNSEQLLEIVYPFYAAGLEIFSAEHCMFESNFPVCKESGSYITLWNLYKRVAKMAELSAEEKAACFSGTAKRVYSL